MPRQDPAHTHRRRLASHESRSPSLSPSPTHTRRRGRNELDNLLGHAGARSPVRYTEVPRMRVPSPPPPAEPPLRFYLKWGSFSVLFAIFFLIYYETFNCGFQDRKAEEVRQYGCNFSITTQPSLFFPFFRCNSVNFSDPCWDNVPIDAQEQASNFSLINHLLSFSSAFITTAGWAFCLLPLFETLMERFEARLPPPAIEQQIPGP